MKTKTLTPALSLRRERGKCSIFVALIAALLFAPAARAGDLQSQVSGLVNAADLRQTRIGILIVDLTTGKKLAQINPDEPMQPASNMKLITTAAAANKLGVGFVFRTELRRIDPADWPAQAVAIGDASTPTKETVLLVHGDGDPGLGDPEILKARDMDVEQFMQTWVKAVKDAGIQHVERLIVDDRVFDREFVHPTWHRDQLNEWYSAEVGGVNFYDNCIEVYAEPTAHSGARVRIRPATPFMSTVNRAVTGPLDRFVVNRRPGTNELIFTGEVKTRQSHGTFVTVNDPPMFFAGVLAARLADAGIPVGHVVRPEMEESLPAGKTIFAYEDPLPTIIQRCNKDSQNLFAESLFKRMGRAVTGAPGSWGNGAAAVRLFLSDQLGPQAAVVNVTDGSGLSAENRVTAGIFVGLLTAMRNNTAAWPVYRDSLSMDRYGGGVKPRFAAVHPRLSAKLYPKTGHINDVSTLTGYMIAAHPGPEHAIAFSLLFNDVKSPIQVKELQDNLLVVMDRYLGKP